MYRRAPLLALPLLLGACAGTSASYVRAPAASAPPRAAPAPSALRAPQVMQGAGLGRVIGARASALTGRFGDARIDLAEGDARKLQFASEACILDIFLYPPEAGSAPVATHVEARERQGGNPTDRARCIAEVENAARS